MAPWSRVCSRFVPLNPASDLLRPVARWSAPRNCPLIRSQEAVELARGSNAPRSCHALSSNRVLAEPQNLAVAQEGEPGASHHTGMLLSSLSSVYEGPALSFRWVRNEQPGAGAKAIPLNGASHQGMARNRHRTDGGMPKAAKSNQVLGWGAWWWPARRGWGAQCRYTTSVDSGKRTVAARIPNHQTAPLMGQYARSHAAQANFEGRGCPLLYTTKNSL